MKYKGVAICGRASTAPQNIESQLLPLRACGWRKKYGHLWRWRILK